MEIPVEKQISNLIASQFPSFYNEEGPTFIAFVKAYFEWLEETGNPLYYNRRLMDNFDIDNTLDEFLEHFQKKFLYGIPFDIIIDPRFLIKHVLDAYRSKGSVQCFKLLFRLIYDVDVDVYLPGVDLFKASDGTWVQPRYLEVTDSTYNPTMVGKQITGISSGATAIVESVVRMPINNNILTLFFISNVKPSGGDFTVGEIVVESDLIDTTDFATLLNASPTVIGSLGSLNIINGGQNFATGDQLGIAHFDANNAVISAGIGGKVKVTSTSAGNGQLNFAIQNYGFGVTQSANIFLYADPTDLTANGAIFSLSPLASAQTIQYNTDLICNYANTTLNAASFSFPGNTSANVTSANLNQILQFTNGSFGSLSALTNIRTGQNYTKAPSIFIRDVNPSLSMPGNVSYNTTSANITGTSTWFDAVYSNNDTIILQANGSVNTFEYHIIKQVVNSTVIVLYDKPVANSTASAKYKVAPIILPSNFTSDNIVMYAPDATLNGNNSIVIGRPSFGSGVVSSAVAIDSGKGYIDGEFVYLYPNDVLAAPTIVSAGTGYMNGDPVAISGGEPYKKATGSVVTYANGTINTITWSQGSGYQYLPKIYVKSATGTGAVLTTSIIPLDTTVQVQATVQKKGIGVQRGYWSTTRSMASNDKRLHDSYFWQDFSYQLEAKVTMDKYRNILYSTFHPAGSEMFGKYKNISQVTSPISIGYSSSTPTVT